MRDLASLFRARDAVVAYELRGLAAARRDAVFQEWHVRPYASASARERTLRQFDAGDVETFFDEHFPRQPRGWRQ